MSYFQQGHALSIGVADYRDPRLRLPSPITTSDATGVADALKDSAVAAYPDSQVHLLPDSGRRATRDEVIKALEELAGRVSPSDTAFVFLCGHGVLGEDGEYYFATEDTALTPSNKVKVGSGVSITKLLDLLRGINAQKLLLVINACFSGHIGPNLAAPQDQIGSPPSSTLGVEILGTGEGRSLISACRATQVSRYSVGDNYTHFGKALIDGLRGRGVASESGYVGLYELYQHIHTSVAAATSNQQDPVLTILQGVGPFPVALYKGGSLGALDPLAIQVTPPTTAAVEVVNRSSVQAISRTARAVEVQTGGDVLIDKSHKVIDFGSGHKMGNVSIGDVGRDIVKVAINTAPAAIMHDLEDAARVIEQLRVDLSKLIDVPDAVREDADDGLRRALEAGTKYNHPRMVDKLESSRKALLSVIESSPAHKLADAIENLLQRL